MGDGGIAGIRVGSVEGGQRSAGLRAQGIDLVGECGESGLGRVELWVTSASAGAGRSVSPLAVGG